MIQFADQPSVGEEIARLSAHIEAATGRLLALIREFHESEEWFQQGFTSCARWLSWRTGIGPSAARERVRVALALGELPAMSAALCAGPNQLLGRPGPHPCRHARERGGAARGGPPHRGRRPGAAGGRLASGRPLRGRRA